MKSGSKRGRAFKGHFNFATDKLYGRHQKPANIYLILSPLAKKLSFKM